MTFDDGDKVSHDSSDVSAVIIDMVPNPVQVPVGSRVIAAWEDKPMYYKGKVVEVDQSIFYAPRYCVKYDDGDKGWQTFTNVRLLPMRVDEGEHIIFPVMFSSDCVHTYTAKSLIENAMK